MLGSVVLSNANGINIPQPAKLKNIKEQVPTILVNDKEGALSQIKEGIKITQKIDDDTSKALLLNQKGIYHYLNAEYGKAVLSFDSAITINRQYQLPARLVENLNNKGYIYKVVGNYTTALKHF